MPLIRITGRRELKYYGQFGGLRDAMNGGDSSQSA